MNKRDLLNFIESLPDDLSVQPMQITEGSQVERNWESMGRRTELGGVYERSVENTLTLQLDFRTRYQGEFRRTYENPDGIFRNVHRVK